MPRRIAQACITERQARRSSAFDAAIFVREVPEAHVGLLFVDGQLVRELAPGVHAFWKIGRNLRVELVDLRVKALEVGEQELLTKDKESLRVHLNASYRFRDVQLTVRNVRDPVDFLYKEIQLGLRSAVAKRSLGALLEHKGSLDRDVFARVHDKLAALGIDLHGDRRQRARAHHAVAAAALRPRLPSPPSPRAGAVFFAADLAALP